MNMAEDGVRGEACRLLSSRVSSVTSPSRVLARCNVWSRASRPKVLKRIAQFMNSGSSLRCCVGQDATTNSISLGWHAWKL